MNERKWILFFDLLNDIMELPLSADERGLLIRRHAELYDGMTNIENFFDEWYGD